MVIFKKPSSPRIQDTVNVVQEGNNYYVTVDGIKYFVDESLKNNALSTITTSGSLITGKVKGTDNEVTVNLTGRASVPVYKDGNDYYIEDYYTDGSGNKKTRLVKLSEQDALKVVSNTTTVIKGASIKDSSGNDAAFETASSVTEWLSNVSTTSDFVMYGDRIESGNHIDGNICTNELVGTQDILGSGRTSLNGLDRYSIILNKDSNNLVKFNNITGSVIVGTNIDTTNSNLNNYTDQFTEGKIIGDPSITDVANEKSVIKTFPEGGKNLHDSATINTTYKDLSSADSSVKTVIKEVVNTLSSDAKRTLSQQGLDDSKIENIIYAIYKNQDIEQGKLREYSEKILSQIQITDTLDRIAVSGQNLIDQAVSKANIVKDTFSSGLEECKKLYSYLKSKADNNETDSTGVYYLNLSQTDIGQKNNGGTEGVLGDNSQNNKYIEKIMTVNSGVGATIIFNVVLPDSVRTSASSEIEMGKINHFKQYDDHISYEAQIGNYYWNFGDYKGTIKTSDTGEGIIIAPNATFDTGGKSRDGSVVARTIKQGGAEIHQARARSFDSKDVSSYNLTPSTESTTTYVITPTTDKKVNLSIEPAGAKEYWARNKLYNVKKVTTNLTIDEITKEITASKKVIQKTTVTETVKKWYGEKKPDTPHTPETPDTPTPETPETPHTPDTPDKPGTPEKPKTPKKSETPEVPETPEEVEEIEEVEEQSEDNGVQDAGRGRWYGGVYGAGRGRGGVNGVGRGRGTGDESTIVADALTAAGSGSGIGIWAAWKKRRAGRKSNRK